MPHNPPSPELPEVGILPKKFPDLHTSGEVQNAVGRYDEHVPNNPEKTIGVYLGNLAGRHGLLGGEGRRREAQIAHHVIRPGEIPDRYWELQKRIAREQGHGNIEITQEMRDEHSEIIIADQEKSLSRWVEYLNNPDVDYPTWFRYFTVRSVLKMSDFNKDKGEFGKRSRGTTSLYPDLDREALAYVYDSVSKKLKGEETDDEKMVELLKGLNFSKLYAHAIEGVTPASQEQRKKTAGQWVRFEQTDDESESLRLSESLQGHGTGWCTAGEEVAHTYLESGDFYIFYSYDDNNDATIPRITIRTDYGKVVEVRGVFDKRQELEPELIDTAMEKLKELPSGDEYLEKAADMKRLTEIDHKHSRGEELTKEDLSFVREITRPIKSFGYNHEMGFDGDPRIEEILSGRDFFEDMSIIFGTEDRDEIAVQLIQGYDNDQGYELAEFLHKQYGFDQPAKLGGRAADAILEVSDEYSLASCLKYFEDRTLDKTIARRLVLSGFDWEMSMTPYAFHGIDKRTVDKLIQNGLGEGVARYAGAYEDVDSDWLASKLIDAGYVSDVMSGLPEFDGLNSIILERLIADDTALSDLFFMRDYWGEVKVASMEHQEYILRTVKILAEAGYGNEVWQAWRTEIITLKGSSLTNNERDELEELWFFEDKVWETIEQAQGQPEEPKGSTAE